MLTSRELSVAQVQRWILSQRLFAIVDACDAPSVPVRARAMMAEDDSTAVSLYKGRSEEELWAIAPYLLEVDEAAFAWITQELWGTPWGFFILSDATLDELRQHFRKFLTVRTPENEEWYFRFYDPRVLPTYLTSCTPAEVDEFLGPARAVCVTNRATYGVDVYARATAAADPVRVTWVGAP